MSKPRYIWRTLTPQQQLNVFHERLTRNRPWHSRRTAYLLSQILFTSPLPATSMRRTSAMRLIAWTHSPNHCWPHAVCTLKRYPPGVFFPIIIMFFSQLLIFLRCSLNLAVFTAARPINGMAKSKPAAGRFSTVPPSGRCARNATSTPRLIMSIIIRCAMATLRAGTNGRGAVPFNSFSRLTALRLNASGAPTRCAITATAGMMRNCETRSLRSESRL